MSGQLAKSGFQRYLLGARTRYVFPINALWTSVMFGTGRPHDTILVTIAKGFFCLCLLHVVGVRAAEPGVAGGAIWGAQVKVSRGVVSIERDGQRYPGIVGARLKEKDVIQTGGNGSVGILFNDNSTLSLGPDAEVLLQRYAYDSTTYMGAFDAYIKRGTVSVQAGNIAKQAPEAMRMVTPKAEVTGTAKNYVVSVGE